MALNTASSLVTPQTASTAFFEGVLLSASGVVFVRRAMAILAFTGLLFTLANSLTLHHVGWDSLGGLLVTAMGTVAYFLVRRDRVRRVLCWLLWGLTATVLGLPFVVGGMRTPALLFLPALCLTAAWLLSLRCALMLFAFTTVVMVVFVVAEGFGYTPPSVPRTSLAYAMFYIVSLLCLIAVSAETLNRFQLQLDNIGELNQSLKTQVDAAQQSEARFSALFRANPVPSATIDDHGLILDVNDAWVALFALPPERAIGKTAQDLSIWTSPEEYQGVAALWAQDGRVNGFPITLTTSGGVRKPFLMYVAPVDSAGQRRFVTSLLDQSDRYAAEAAQRAINEGLELRVAQRTTELSRTVASLTAAKEELVQAEKLASLGAMVAGISHELNTPIGNTVTVSSTLQSHISDFRSLMLRGELKRSTLGSFLDNLQEMSGVILRSMVRASELISSFKQVSIDRSSERRRAFLLDDLITDILASVSPGLGQNNISFVREIAPGLHCDTYPGPVGQVLTNLLQNAVIHAFVPGQHGVVTVRAVLDDQSPAPQVVLSVSDNGAGMSEHTRRHAFDPFFTTRMGQGGSGLGLSISHQIATTLLGGSLVVESAPLAGSTFTLRFLQVAPPLNLDTQNS
jgi:PAS domain S-box-containing protein